MAAVSSAAGAQAQNQLFQRAIDLENASRYREAIAAWRAVMSSGATTQGILGLERIFTQLGQEDSVLPPLDSALAVNPADRALRAAQLRLLRSMGHDEQARTAFDVWRHIQPRDVAPYHDYAMQLLEEGRTAAADTVLQQATAALGSVKGLTIEVAQLRAALGLWPQAALAWRDALAEEAYIESAAIYSLTPTPAAQRDTVRAILARPPVTAPLKRTMGSLELAWGAPRSAWRVLSTLTAADSAYDTWGEFAHDAERQGSWLAARDAYAVMQQQRPNASTAMRAAQASMNAGDPASALTLLASAREMLQPYAIRTQVLPLQLRALSQLGRGADAEALVAKTPDIDAGTKKSYARLIAWAWIRGGDVEKARAALGGATGEDEDEVTAWLALYDGNLAQARPGLRRPVEVTAEAVTVMTFLGRTSADSSRTAGAAFLALARGDSARAAAAFERAAGELSDAAPFLLALAARVQAARRQDPAAIVLWKRIVTQYASAPEAAESDLEWSRALRRAKDNNGAIERLEHLLLTYPQSALLPQARRELESLRTGADQ
jgi:tetratricopeptide (TPR) repeat protein